MKKRDDSSNGRGGDTVGAVGEVKTAVAVVEMIEKAEVEGVKVEMVTEMEE